MAIRIDLLPRYVALRRWFKRILAVCLVLVGGFAAVLFLLYYREQLRLQTLVTNRENIRTFADRSDAAVAAAKAAEGEAAPLQATVNFFVDAGRSGAERAALLDLIRRYVYDGAVVGSLDLLDGQTAKFTGMVRTPDDYARFLLNLRRGTVPVGVLFSELPTGEGIQGWPNRSGAGQAQDQAQPAGTQGETAGSATTLPYYVFDNRVSANAKLREPIVVPVAPGETAEAPPADGAAPGAPAPPAAP